MKNQIKKNIIKNCPVCGNISFKNIFNKKWKNSSFVKCRKCKLIFQNPQENLINTISRYDKNYFNYELKNQHNFYNLIKKTLDDFKIINILPKNALILEIGSATGLFLQYMDSLGFKSTGIDLCKESVEYGSEKYGVNIINGRLEDMNFNGNSFDFIHFSHLLEHLNNPVDFLLKIYNLLKKGGIALLTTPNSKGVFARFYNESWRCIVDDHLFIFNKSNLKHLLLKLKFKVIKNETWGSIPKGKSINCIKNISDRIVKISGLGDVVCFLVRK